MIDDFHKMMVRIKALYILLFFGLLGDMALRKYAPSSDARSLSIKPLRFSSNVRKNALVEDLGSRGNVDADVDIDLREVYFLIMHFLSAGPCHRTYGQFWNELLEHQLLPRRYHAWYSRTGARSGDENDNGMSFPLNYNMLVERYIFLFFADFNKY